MRTEQLSQPSAAIEALYDGYRRPILAYLVRMVGDREAAEDLCQETFLKALRSWAQHDPRANVVSWLYRIATNSAYDYLRRHRRVRFTPLVEQDPVPSGAHTMQLRVAEGEPVRATLAQLPARYRDLLVLHAYEGRSTREIATALGCTNIAVKMRLFRARARFREIYREA